MCDGTRSTPTFNRIGKPHRLYMSLLSVIDHCRLESGCHKIRLFTFGMQGPNLIAPISTRVAD